ncbi:MAG: alkaline phosphatase family protein [Deltaproteobacteria bacterium]|nr:alkaline phosphatase family protein [Deltaproteobacteria bacterium]
MPRVAVLGLDSAPPALFFHRYRSEMPNLERLMRSGLVAHLESTNPPITVPAWTSMMSSKDPGQLGFYGFRNRKDYSYDGYQFANGALVREPLVWDVLGRHGKRSILLGVPQTFPPRPIEGEMVTCFLTPSTESAYTYPASLKPEVERVTDGYVLDVDDFRTSDKQALLGRIHEKTRKHWTLAKHMLRTRRWDFFMIVEMGVDRIHHAFWSYCDPAHHKYVAGNPWENVLRDYYRYLDREIGEVLELLGDDTIVLVVSDHGSKKMDGGICINEWLIANGYLTLIEQPAAPTPIGKAKIDWSRTRAWGDGGYYGRLFLNVRGREPQGTIDPADVERVRGELTAAIEAITDPSGRNIGSKVHRPEDVYRATRGVPPDLIVYFGDLDWRSVGSVGGGSIHTFENDTGPDESNHDWHGIFVMNDPRRPRPEPDLGSLPVFRIYDVAPTVLAAMGIPVPDDMIGRALVEPVAESPWRRLWKRFSG